MEDSINIKIAAYNTLKVARIVSIGAYLEDGKEGILLPLRFMPANLQVGDELEVFLYHDSDNRLIATTQRPLAVAGEIALLRVVEVSPIGAFMDWGLMKDLFVPKSKQLEGMRPGGDYLVKIYVDEQTGRAVATEKIDYFLQNEELTVKEFDPVDLMVYRSTDIGYVVIINHLHTGVLHFNEVFKPLKKGDRLSGFIKKIRPEGTIDVVEGIRGFAKVESHADQVFQLLQQNNGYLPYHDKSSPEEIYDFFGISKKNFKMAVGTLYKEKKIILTKTGIKQTEEN